MEYHQPFNYRHYSSRSPPLRNTNIQQLISFSLVQGVLNWQSSQKNCRILKTLFFLSLHVFKINIQLRLGLEIFAECQMWLREDFGGNCPIDSTPPYIDCPDNEFPIMCQVYRYGTSIIMQLQLWVHIVIKWRWISVCSISIPVQFPSESISE